MTPQADPYGLNPLVEELKNQNPGVYRMALSETAPPTLFASGDLPPFTASGVDPQVLNRLPYTMRHWAASNPDAGAVLGVIEEYGSDPMYTLEHPGLEDYRDRVHRWASGLDKPAAAEMTSEEQDALLTELFGE